MTRTDKLFERLVDGQRLSFRDLQRLAEAMGFRLDRIAASHHIYRHPGIGRILNLQPDGKDAKPYQVRQFLDMIEQYGLKADEQ